MASAGRTFTRALRSTPTTSAIKTAAPRRFAQAPKFQARRGYSSEAPKPSSGGGNGLLYGGIAAVLLGGGAYYTLGSKSTPIQDAKTSSAAGSKSGVITPTKEDYQKVYDAVAKKLIGLARFGHLRLGDRHRWFERYVCPPVPMSK
ncbi:hypothetical protein KC347_g92 [Hortaea werneckii]|nr:hypothetical protein KC347_g92 [Hortaea werneckii]